ncbi:uncharacterized protein LOC124170349 [Ischnura elegans]|uniref:uncharacterized protein LOC124170349 n=1 Tax=Ischnura elegans TaxID=197161 RepID=UPI001ED88802|nr:uncharacterized protein LOC124170349 [Ischnura elegans]
METRGPYKRHLLPDSNSPMTPHTRKRLQAMAAAAIEEIVAAPNVETLENDDNNGVDPGEEDSHLFSDYDVDTSDDEDPDTNVNDAYQDGDHPLQKLMDFLRLNKNPFEKRITINPGEIFLAVVTHAVVHNLSMSATCAIFGMLNFILGTSIFPSTRYLFKSLFNPHAGCEVHLVCEKCKAYLGKHTGNGTFACNDCDHENIIKGYRYDYAFITLDVKSQLKRMVIDGDLKLATDRKTVSESYGDIHCGSMYKTIVPTSSGVEDVMYLSCTFNCDAAPINRHSRTTITPMLLMINEASIKCRGKNIINAGLWYGKEKPRMEVFLEPFKNLFNDLCEVGFPVTIGKRQITVKMSAICCCVDSVARAPMQGVTAVNGYYCCSWCLVKGEEVHGTIKYPLTTVDPDVRTEPKFLECCQELARTKKRVLGVKMVSPLINVSSFSMVWGFVPDYMHCVLLGTVRRFLSLWIDGTGAPYYIGNPVNVNLIDSFLKSIQPPQYLKRAPVLLSAKGTMKARELENFFLFYSVPVLNGVLSAPYFHHWKLLVSACNLLLQDVVTDEDIDTADLLLLEFVCKTEELYGKYEMTYNMHQLLHMAESVRRWGPLWTRTAYPFESALGEMTRVIKATRGVPHQIVRQMELNLSRKFIARHAAIGDGASSYCSNLLNYRHVMKSDLLGPEVVALGSGVPYHGSKYDLLVDSPLTEYQRIVRKGMLYSSYTKNKESHTDNSYVELFDGRFARILHIIVCTEEDGNDAIFIIMRVCKTVVIPKIKHIKKCQGYEKTISCAFSKVKSVAVAVGKEGDLYLCSIPRKHFLMNV